MPSALRLRPLRPDDAASYAAWALDADFRLASAWSEPFGDNHLSHWRDLIASPPPDLVRLAAEEEGELVGYVDLAGDGPASRELGVTIGPSSNWGRGLGRRVVGLALTYAFDVLGLCQLVAHTHATNPRAQRLRRSAGFRQVDSSDQEEYRGELVPVLRYRIARAADSVSA